MSAARGCSVPGRGDCGGAASGLTSAVTSAHPPDTAAAAGWCLIAAYRRQPRLCARRLCTHDGCVFQRLNSYRSNNSSNTTHRLLESTGSLAFPSPSPCHVSLVCLRRPMRVEKKCQPGNTVRPHNSSSPLPAPRCCTQQCQAQNHHLLCARNSSPVAMVSSTTVTFLGGSGASLDGNRQAVADRRTASRQ